MPGPIEVFISYAPQDAALRRELEEHLAIMRRQGIIRAWHAEQIGPGQSWRTIIDSHVSSAQLILLLISSSFFDSDACHDREMAKALERWQRGEAQVVPILLRPCSWEQTQLWRLMPLPDNRNAVTSWASRDEAWANVARGLWRVVERMAQGQGMTAPVPFAPVPMPPSAPMMLERQSHAGSWSARESAPSYPSYPAAPQPSPRAPAPSYPSAPQPSPRPSAPSDPAMAPWPQRNSAPPYPHAERPSAPSSLSSPRPFSSQPQPQPQPAPRSAFARRVLMLCSTAAIGVGAFMLASEPQPGQESRKPLPTATNASPVATPRAKSSRLPAPAPAPAPGPASASARAPVPAPASTSEPASAPTPSSDPAVPGVCSSPCCGGSLCAVDVQNISRPLLCKAGDEQCFRCSSGRQCVPGSCATLLDPARRLMLRLAHASIQGQQPPQIAQVCVRPVGSPEDYYCTRYAQAADLPHATATGGMMTRLPITVADLMSGRGIDILVWHEQRALALHGSAAHTDVGVAALCQGLKFDLKDPANHLTTIGHVAFYLDDP